MPVTLQNWPAPESAVPRLIDYSGNQVPFLGGPISHLDRLGTRLGLAVTLPPMRANVAMAQAWVSDLLRAKRDGAIMEWPQPDQVPPDNGAVRVAVDGGETVNLKNLTPGQTIPRSFFSVITNGRRYVHNVFSAPQVVPGTGNVDITITPQLRVPLLVGDVVEFNPPAIQGYLEGDEFSWTLDKARHVGLSFTILEEE